MVSYVSARLARENDGSLEERKGGQSALSPSHPHSEIFVDVFRVFLLDSLVQHWEEVGHQIHILEFKVSVIHGAHLENQPLASDESSLQELHGKGNIFLGQSQVLNLIQQNNQI